MVKAGLTYCGVLAVVACHFGMGYSGFGAPATVGAPAPAWQLVDINGRNIRSSDFAGKVVLINFFRTTCTPCLWEIPDLIALQQQYGPDGLVVVGVGAQQDANTLRQFSSAEGINYIVCPSVDSMLWDYNVFPVGAIPLTAVIDRAGHVAAWYRYYQEKEYHEAVLQPLLTGPPRLSFRAQGQQIEISWATNLQNFFLETRRDYGLAGSWQEITNAVVLSNGMHRVNLPGKGSSGYFRLRQR